ncbi:MAG: NTP transferase domain-containing protein [Marinicaulis sp.]|nr:NTP transferase domain-containing protein [Marinicaulis sp.]NNL89204.1 NTP transferase domain-containing protein [Marinicaulis sp.]
MRGDDKAEIRLRGERLIDHVIRGMTPQVDEILIAGPSKYGAKIENIVDRSDGPAGPVAALWSVANWLRDHRPAVKGFLAAPVDGPFLRDDLYACLAAGDASSIAETDDGLHPTFGYWRCDKILNALQKTEPGAGVSLHRLAESIGADKVYFDDANAFFNINSPDDLKRAEEIIQP